MQNVLAIGTRAEMADMVQKVARHPEWGLHMAACVNHESRGMQKLGRTVCINPGSAYSDWTLQGVVVDLKGAKVKRYVPTTG